MGSICKVERKDLSYALEKIDYWYKKGLKYLTIITPIITIINNPTNI